MTKKALLKRGPEAVFSYELFIMRGNIPESAVNINGGVCDRWSSLKNLLMNL
jgi:hypothetical protein